MINDTYIPSVDDLTEAHHTIAELAEENERLNARLAVKQMDASEEEKLSAQQIIDDLQEQVRRLEIEVAQLKRSRDTYMREAGEKQKQINYWKYRATKGKA